MVATNGVIDFWFYNMSMDFTLSQPPAITTTQLELYLNGTFFDGLTGEYYPSEGKADLALNFSTTDCLEAMLSEYTVDSFTHMIYQLGLLQFFMTQAEIPPSSGIEITTSSLKGLLPGLEETYGEDKPVAVNFTASAPPMAIFNSGEIGGSLTFDMTFEVLNETTDEYMQAIII